MEEWCEGCTERIEGWRVCEVAVEGRILKVFGILEYLGDVLLGGVVM